MSTNTGIEWTDATWNPIRGCSRVSEGCRNCYAETMANRFKGEVQPYEGLVSIDGKWTGKIAFVEKHLLDPLRWKGKPIYDASADFVKVGYGRMRIFVNSMSDLFHPNVTDEMLDKIFAVMALCPQHTFQVLTKRPERMLAYLSYAVTRARVLDAGAAIVQGDEWHNRKLSGTPYSYCAPAGVKWEAGKAYAHEAYTTWPLPNVWLGVSVENQAAADERIPLLLQTPAAVRFLSCEPMLGAIELDWWLKICKHWKSADSLPKPPWNPEYPKFWYKPQSLVGAGWKRPIDWVIAGGESGPGARPMHPDWARSLRDQCVAAGVPFFFKQWGEWTPWVDIAGAEVLPSDICMSPAGEMRNHDLVRGDACMRRVGKKAAGSLLDGKAWKQLPEAEVGR